MLSIASWMMFPGRRIARPCTGERVMVAYLPILGPCCPASTSNLPSQACRCFGFNRKLLPGRSSRACRHHLGRLVSALAGPLRGRMESAHASAQTRGVLATQIIQEPSISTLTVGAQAAVERRQHTARSARACDSPEHRPWFLQPPTGRPAHHPAMQFGKRRQEMSGLGKTFLLVAALLLAVASQAQGARSRGPVSLGDLPACSGRASSKLPAPPGSDLIPATLAPLKRQGLAQRAHSAAASTSPLLLQPALLGSGGCRGRQRFRSARPDAPMCCSCAHLQRNHATCATISSTRSRRGRTRTRSARASRRWWMPLRVQVCGLAQRQLNAHTTFATHCLWLLMLTQNAWRAGRPVYYQFGPDLGVARQLYGPSE